MHVDGARPRWTYASFLHPTIISTLMEELKTERIDWTNDCWRTMYENMDENAVIYILVRIIPRRPRQINHIFTTCQRHINMNITFKVLIDARSKCYFMPHIFTIHAIYNIYWLHARCLCVCVLCICAISGIVTWLLTATVPTRSFMRYATWTYSELQKSATHATNYTVHTILY